MNWNDGGVPHSARKVKFYGPSGVDASGNSQWSVDKGIYILESWSPTRPQFTQRRYDESRAPNGAFGLDDFVESSAVVQLAYAATEPVDNGYAFTTARRGTAATSESFVVTNVDEPEEQGGIRKQSIRLQKIVVATGPSVYPAA